MPIQSEGGFIGFRAVSFCLSRLTFILASRVDLLDFHIFILSHVSSCVRVRDHGTCVGVRVGTKYGR